MKKASIQKGNGEGSTIVRDPQLMELLKEFEPTDMFRKGTRKAIDIVHKSKRLGIDAVAVFGELATALHNERPSLAKAVGEEQAENLMYSAGRDLETIFNCIYSEKEMRTMRQLIAVEETMDQDSTISEMLGDVLDLYHEKQKDFKWTLNNLISLAEKMRKAGHSSVDSWLLLSYMLKTDGRMREEISKQKSFIAQAVHLVFQTSMEPTSRVM